MDQELKVLRDKWNEEDWASWKTMHSTFLHDRPYTEKDANYWNRVTARYIDMRRKARG